MFCRGNFETCDLNTHIEFFHSLVPSFLLFPGDNGDNRILLLDNNCPLYAGSAQSTDCLTGSSSSAAAIVGGVFGGLIAGAVIALGIAALVVVIIVKWRRSRENEEVPPHPKTHRFPTSATEVRYTHNSQSDDPGYEFLPVFNKGSGTEVNGDDFDAEYDIPQVALTGLPSVAADGPQYEVMDPVEEKTAAGSCRAGVGGHKSPGKKQAPSNTAKQPKKKQKSSPRSRKATCVNVDKEVPVTPQAQGGMVQTAPQKPRKHDYLNVDKGPSEKPGSKAPQKLNVNEGPSGPSETSGGKKASVIAASSIGAKSLDAIKTVGIVGKGSPPQQRAFVPIIQQQQEESGFKAMREKLANTSGASVVGEGQSKR